MTDDTVDLPPVKENVEVRGQSLLSVRVLANMQWEFENSVIFRITKHLGHLPLEGHYFSKVFYL